MSLMNLNSMDRSKLIFSIVATGIAFDLINVTATITSTYTIQQHFNVSSSTASWVLTSYSITLSGFIAILGRFGDIIGNFTLFICSSLMFSINSLICALPIPFEILLLFRAFQGIGAAGMIPSGYAILNRLYPNSQSAFSILSSVFSISFGIGFIIGGAFDKTSLGYKGVYYISFGIVLMISFTLFFFFKSMFLNDSKNKDEKISDLDFFGCFLFISGVVLIVAGLTEGSEDWTKPSAYISFTIGIIILLLFFLWNITVERLRPHFKILKSIVVLIPNDALIIENFLLLLIALFLNYISLFTVLLLICNYLQYIENYSPLMSSVMLLPSVIAMVFGTITLALKPNIFPPKLGCVIGFTLMFIGSLILRFTISLKEKFWICFFITQVSIGLGSSIFFPISLNLLIGISPIEFKALVSGIAQTFAQFGTAVGFSILTSIIGEIDIGNGIDYEKKFVLSTYLIIASSTIGLLISSSILIKEFLKANCEKEEISVSENDLNKI